VRRALGLAFASLAIWGCAGSRIDPRDLTGWHAAGSGSVSILAQGSPEETAAFAHAIACYDAAFERLLGAPLAPAASTSIAVVRDHELGRRFHLGRGVAGWATTALEGEISFVLAQPSPVATRHVLLHEYTHLILSRNRRTPLPRWYDEGMAEYFSTLSIRDGALVVGAIPGDRLHWVVARDPLPLAILFGESLPRSGEEVLDYYATSWALTHYLLSTPELRRQLSVFVDHLGRGEELDLAREAAFGRSFEDIERDLGVHLDYLARHVASEVVLDAGSLAIRPGQPPRRLERPETAQRLGLLALASVEGNPDGERWLHPAVVTSLLGDAAGARAQAGFAEGLAIEGRLDRARAEIAEAVAAAPEDPVVLVRAGRIELAAGAPEAARRVFGRALERDDGSAAGWFGLGLALEAIGRAHEAEDALMRARERGWSPWLDLALGRLRLGAGRTEEATALLLPLARAPHGGSVSERARALLEEAGLLEGS